MLVKECMTLNPVTFSPKEDVRVAFKGLLIARFVRRLYSRTESWPV